MKIINTNGEILDCNGPTNIRRILEHVGYVISHHEPSNRYPALQEPVYIPKPTAEIPGHGQSQLREGGAKLDYRP